ncbi:MAG: Crp/Fnr family transcriptional regulator [Thermoanaerobaculia bacterium]
MNLKDLLKEVEIFSNLSNEELEEISRVARKKSFKKDELILRETEFGNALYLIGKGGVKVSIYSEEGEETILTFLKEGDFFGEMALFLDSLRCANVVAISDTEVYIFQREEFYKILEKNFKITRKIIEILCRRLKRANFFIEGLAHLDVYGRFVRFLREIAKEMGKEEGNWISIPRFSQQDLASKVASTRETISRILANLKESELLEIKKDKMLINKKLIK